MSLTRINHVVNELKKLKYVIEKLINNYESDFKEFDEKHEFNAFDTDDANIEEKIKYINKINDLKSFAQFPSELILVKHVALIESMIINVFRRLTIILDNKKCHEKYFIKRNNFSNVHVSIKEISDMTEKEIDMENMEFWYYYGIMKTIRNSVAHGNPLFTIKYEELNKFNSKINIIHRYSEKNECSTTKNQFPSLLYPTHSIGSIWYCHLSKEIINLSR